MKKSLLYTWTLPLLIFSIAVAGVRATTVSVEPSPHPDIDEPDVIFKVNVTIQDVTNLAAFEFKLGYNASVVNAINITYGGIFEIYDELGSVINNTEGWLQYAAMRGFGETFTFNGSGVLATITFNATGPGGTGLHLYDTLLGAPQDPTHPTTPVPIAHVTTDGSVVVIPEFPPSMIMPLFLIITLIAVILGKMIWSRRGRGPSIAS